MNSKSFNSAFGIFAAQQGLKKNEENPFEKFDKLFQPKVKYVPILVCESSMSLNMRIAIMEKMERMQKELDELKRMQNEEKSNESSSHNGCMSNKRKASERNDNSLPPSKRRCNNTFA